MSKKEKKKKNEKIKNGLCSHMHFHAFIECGEPINSFVENSPDDTQIVEAKLFQGQGGGIEEFA